MKKNLTAIFCMTFLFCLMIIATTAKATKIEYVPTNNGGGNYTLDYTVTNDTLSDPIEWISIYFGQTSDGLNFANTGLFSNFVPDDAGVSQPAGWSSYSFEPSAVDIPGQFNSDIDTSPGIAPGSWLSGFQVTFDMDASGSYDQLYFEVGNFDASHNYQILGNGYTQLAGPAPIPEPSTIILVVLGLATLGLAMKRTSVSN
ncbi:MAG: PEP-CTERM sorting domain-containing protein [bacterium]